MKRPSLRKTSCAALCALTLTATPAFAEYPATGLARIHEPQRLGGVPLPADLSLEEQLNVMISSGVLDEEMRLRSAHKKHGGYEFCVAVTDLDYNGRLELLFRHAMTLMDISGPHAAGVVDIPIDISLSAYEISADGRLERLRAENGYDWPDLMNLQPLSEIDEHGTRWHHVRTVTVSRSDYFTGNDPSYTYTASYQRVALDHGTLRCQLLAVEKGSYRDVDSPSTCRKIHVSASVFDGDPAHTNMSGRQFQQTYLYQTFDEALLPASSIRWVSGDELNRDPREALAASWQGFAYGAIDGKG